MADSAPNVCLQSRLRPLAEDKIKMAPEVIVLSSDDAHTEIPVSPIQSLQPSVSFPVDYLDFSDDVDFPPSPKRRRVTPPVSTAAISETIVIESDARHGNRRAAATTAPRKTTFTDDDPIVCSSSPALPIRASPKASRQTGVKPARPRDVVEELWGESFSSEGSPLVTRPVKAPLLSSKTAALLAELDNNRLGRKPGTSSASGKGGPSQAKPASVYRRPPLLTKPPAAAPPSSIEDFSSQPVPPATQVAQAVGRRQRLTTPEREEKARVKEAEKRARAAERLAGREAKAREKQLAADLADVNKARYDKKVSAVEMIVRIPAVMAERGNTVTLAQKLLQESGVQVDLDATTTAQSGLDADIITWKRKVKAQFDEEAGHWVPLDRILIKDEGSHVLCVLDAKRFVAMVQEDVTAGDIESGGQKIVNASLEAHVEAVTGRWPACRPIYLIEGLEAHLRKNRSAKNRSYQAAVRAQSQTETDGTVAADAASRTTQKRKNTTKASVTQSARVDEDAVEDALLRLQVTHNALIHHTSAAPETAQWITIFTQHISTIPYKSLHPGTAEASFCMDAGQVRTGDDKDDTFVKMLQEIVRVTLPVAYGIAAEYPSVIKMIDAMQKDGPLFCQDLRKCSNRNGAFTDARIGPAVSRRLHKIFLGQDPDSMDV